MKPLLIKDNIFLEHNTGNHPESVDRLLAIYDAIKPLEVELQIEKPLRATKEQILLVHTQEHYNRVKEYSQLQKPFDADTVTSTKSFDAASFAAGAGITALDAVNKNMAHLAFCAIRPPGHHATPSNAMGFCLFNNIAITARYAQTVGFKKIFIIDFDVHHGNGTQEIFWEDDTVFYFSTHQAFTYPGTGNPDDIGAGRGKGYTFNYPLMPNSTDSELLDVYYNELPPLLKSFQPDLILISAGYDLHESDPLATLDITYKGIQTMIEEILLLQSETPKIFFLEGGYNINALVKNVSLTLEILIDFSKKGRVKERVNITTGSL